MEIRDADNSGALARARCAPNVTDCTQLWDARRTSAPGRLLLDVALSLRGLAGVLAWDEDQALELGDEDAVLV